MERVSRDYTKTIFVYFAVFLCEKNTRSHSRGRRAALEYPINVGSPPAAPFFLLRTTLYSVHIHLHNDLIYW